MPTRRRAETATPELYKLGRERERLADIGAIAAQIVHDLGNPLAGLSMQAQLLLRRVQSGEVSPADAVRKPAEQILTTVRRLEGLVKEFMAAAREPRLELNAVHLPHLLQEVLDFWQPLAGARTIDINMITDDVGEIRADSAQLRRVIENLVKNAIEAIDCGPGCVSIQVSVLTPETVRVSVEDTGPGISDTVEPFRLFETTKAEGTGLGLAVAKQIVLAHGGGIRFTHRKPHGTVFHIDLPRQGPPEPRGQGDDYSADNYFI
ncbi:MAG TPA: HAMP domain-containing sensor histidine kinase [Candidatus Binatia bacterium]|jgi:signal transduction histidine kinase